jgi:CDP-paratose 2-epimerase
MGKTLVVTGSSGLIGSEVCTHFAARGWQVHGVDNNSRAYFLGRQGDTRWNEHRLEAELSNFEHHELDIRDRRGMLSLIDLLRPLCHLAPEPTRSVSVKVAAPAAIQR